MKRLSPALLLSALLCVALTTAGCQERSGPGFTLTDDQLEEGLNAFQDQVKEDIQDNPVILERIGTIRTIEMDDDASMDLPGENDFVFKLSGTKGSAVMTATCITIDEYTEDVTAGTLKMPNGDTVNMFP